MRVLQLVCWIACPTTTKGLELGELMGMGRKRKVDPLFRLKQMLFRTPMLISYNTRHNPHRPSFNNLCNNLINNNGSTTHP